MAKEGDDEFTSIATNKARGGMLSSAVGMKRDLLVASLSSCSKVTDPWAPTEERIAFLVSVNSEGEAEAVPTRRTF